MKGFRLSLFYLVGMFMPQDKEVSLEMSRGFPKGSLVDIFGLCTCVQQEKMCHL